MSSQMIFPTDCTRSNRRLTYANCSSYSTDCFLSNCSNTFWTSANHTLVVSNFTETAIGVDEKLEEFREQSRFWIQRVLVPVILIVGLIGNTITIVILTRRRMRSSTNNYLAALAIFDMLYLMCVFGLSLSHYPGIQSPSYVVYWHIRPFAIMLTDACSNTSVWLTVTFTIERYIAVCHPIKGKVYCTESRAKKVIAFVSLICFFLTLPTPFEWTVIEITDMDTNKTMMTMDFSDFGNNHLYKTVYYTMTAILFIFVPLFLLAIFNSFLIRSVHLSKIQRDTMTHHRESRDSLQQENKITIMLIAVVVLFFVCQLPTAAILVYTSLHTVPPHTNKEALLLGLGNIFNFLVCINAAGNFVLYCLFSQKYRRTFLQTFCPCIKSKLVRLQSVYQRSAYSNVDDSLRSSRTNVVRRSTLNRVSKPSCSGNFRESETSRRECLDITDCHSSIVLPLTHVSSHHDEEERSIVRKHTKFPSIFSSQWKQMLGKKKECGQIKNVTYQEENETAIITNPKCMLTINVHSTV